MPELVIGTPETESLTGNGLRPMVYVLIWQLNFLAGIVVNPHEWKENKGFKRPPNSLYRNVFAV